MHAKSGLEKDGSGVTFNRSFAVIIGWMASYMSRVNATKRGKADFYQNTADEVDSIAKWCKSNQNSDFMEAMEVLTKARTKRPKKAKPAKVEKKTAPVAPGPRAS